MENLENHHWTLNHQENGEILHLTASSHARIHGLINGIEDNIAIKREIMYELVKEIPLTEIPDIIDKVRNEIPGFRIRDMRRNRYKVRNARSKSEHMEYQNIGDEK